MENILKSVANSSKNDLITDLLVCLSHDYDREEDLLCMTEQYYLYPEKRAELENEMLELLLGKPYINPFAFYHNYNQNHVVELEKILDGFEIEMKITSKPRDLLQTVIFEISELHDKCSGDLIDEWRVQKLETYLLAVADFAEATSILENNKRW